MKDIDENTKKSIKTTIYFVLGTVMLILLLDNYSDKKQEAYEREINATFEEGYESGYEDGYEIGYHEGYNSGYSECYDSYH